MLLLSRSKGLPPNDYANVQHILHGREFRAEELPLSEKVIKDCVKKGYVAVRSGIVPLNESVLDLLTDRKKWLCARCGNRDQETFATCTCGRCRKNCIYCRHCLTMGIVRSCTKLVTWCGPEPALHHRFIHQNGPLCVWDGTLSDEQSAAAKALNQALECGKSFLVWAVTGSGKTEMIYPAIERQLKNGRRVVLATPRTDVVRELLPRMRAAFPDVPISGLYAGSEESNADAPLVVSTAHQLIRYSNCFDCIFIDEVDAFPYHFDRMLEFAIRKAARPGAPIAYLSATPPADLKNDYLSGKLCGVMLARRYHGHPLPEPQFRWIGNWLKLIRKGQLPSLLCEWLRAKMGQKRQMFVFVSSVTLSRDLTELLQRAGFSGTAGVHAEDPHRHAKVSDFRKGKINILVTTTILERGVTVPGVEVCVVGADDPVFDDRALVQISGRVGRSAEFPSGDIIFFHNGKTMAMVRARKQIEQMNQNGGFR
ncbi:DEAD/DEAH box helicase family protein [Sporolactobacillus shoreicorticis]|uniref:DEAD/DEAH box helicase n=1 Tax=Sporolactobacillus shoreicorticis TaxID=1923877 RepID=A0ABW5RZZ9_9BACL|nr:helicase-related protein [Sporolactobacillus shoreicorticis]MCO7124987.1 DEAD/DEAH box helicase family protein [Sporolactobacillus shoreicorticis]